MARGRVFSFTLLVYRVWSYDTEICWLFLKLNWSYFLAFQVDNLNRAGRLQVASKIERCYSWSESFGWRSRYWCITTVCTSFANSDWKVSCDIMSCDVCFGKFVSNIMLSSSQAQLFQSSPETWAETQVITLCCTRSMRSVNSCMGLHIFTAH